MKVVIFCGGKGYRLREETEFKPKPLVEIGGKPILWHIMHRYALFGYTDFVLCLGYKGEMIRDYFHRYTMVNNDMKINLKSGRITYPNLTDNPKWTITMVDTGLETMTGSRLKQIEKYIDTNLFMLTYGDGIGDINIASLLSFHKKHKTIGTVTGVRPSPRFGELMYERNLVKEFSEKPISKHVMINGGFFVFDRRIFSYLTNNDDCVFEKEPLEHLARDHELNYYDHTGFWHCLDTYRDMEYLNEVCKTKPIPWLINK